MTHELKTDPEMFAAIDRGDKNFEIRRDDRGFQVCDVLVLKETENSAEMNNGAPMKYTGRFLCVVVTYILRGPAYGLAESFVIMSIQTC